ncbi:MAG: DMT family transporter [Oscillospiraceae bacterium]
MTKKNAANILMVVGTMIWGAAFVAQSVGAEFVGAYTFGAIRFFLGTLVVLPFYFFTRAKQKKSGNRKDAPLQSYLGAGALCGIALFLGSLFQQLGVERTTVGKAGFVTVLYVVLVPVFCYFLYGRKITARIYISIFLALAGIFLLCVNENFTVNLGDVYIFIGSIFWAVQILCIERFAAHLDGFKFTIFEFLFCAVINAVFMFVIEKPTWEAISAAAIPLLYSGLLSVGVGFTAQTVCLKYTDPTVASLIMSLESVFAVIFGFLILGQVLTLKQGIGCVLVFAAVIIAQILPKGTKVILTDEINQPQ